MKSYILTILILLLLIPGMSFSQDKGYNLQEGAFELVNLRTETSKTFQNPDGTRTAIISNVPIHELNSEGEWVETDAFISLPSNALAYYYDPTNMSFPYQYSGGGTVKIGVESFYPSRINRSLIRWNTSSIPLNSTIDDANVQVNYATGNTSHRYNIMEVTTDPGDPIILTQTHLGNVFSDIGGGVEYDTGISGFNYVFNNSTFESHMQSRLGEEWMGVGFINQREDTVGFFRSFTAGFLQVTYTPPPDPTLSVSLASWGAPVKGGNTVVVTYNITTLDQINFNITKNKSWISLSNTSGNTSTAQNFTIFAEPNYTGTVRTGQVTVTATSPPGVVGSPKIINVSQNPASTITLPTDEVTGLELYLATDWIEVNSFDVGKSGNVENLELGAGNYVALKPGFHAHPESGSLFRAYIYSPAEEDAFTVNNELDNFSNNFEQRSVSTSTGSDKIFVSEIPEEFDIFQNYPNPFNPVTNIKYSLPVNTKISLKVYDILGKEIATLVNEDREAGYYEVRFDASNIPSGMYFYRIIAGDYIKTSKMLLLK